MKDDNGNPMSKLDFEFELTKDGGSPVTKEGTTDNDGKISFGNLDNINYTIKQTSGPTCYKIDTNPHEFEITADKPDVDVEIINTKIVATLKVNVTTKDIDKAPIKGVEITVTKDTNPDIKYTQITDETGVALFKNIGCGDYTVTQTAVPKCYIKNDKSETFTVDTNSDGKEISLDFENIKISRNLDVTVTINDTDKTPISGAVITATKKDSTDTPIDVTTDKDGLASFKNLTCGEYTITQKSTPLCYIVDTKLEDFIVDITTNGVDGTLTFTNNKASGSLQANVKDDNGEPISGAIITVTKKDGSMTPLSVTTTETGIALFNGFECGTYIVEQTYIPKCYIKTSTNIPQDLIINSVNNGETQILNFDNLKITKVVNVSIKDDKDNPVIGAEIIVTKKDNIDIIETITTDKDGLASFKALGCGDYTVTQISAPKCWIKDITPQDFTIDNVNYNEPLTLNFKDTKILGSIKITVNNDETPQKPVEGAIISIVKNNDLTTTQELITDKDGLVSFDDLGCGDYIVSQKSTLPCLIKSDETKSFTINANGQIETWELTNKKVLRNIEAYLVDNSGIPISGAEFAVTKKDSTDIIETVKTDSTGTALFKNLGCGDYTVTQISTPKCYVNDSIAKDFDVTSDNYTNKLVLDFTNTKILGSVTIKLTDSDGKPVNGSEFTLIKGNDSTTTKKTITDKDGLASFNDLGCGDYTVSQTSTLPCLIKSDETKPFTINTNGQIENWELTNKKVFGNFEASVKDAETGVVLSGADITITKKDDSSFELTAKSDTNGKVLFSNLGCGNYIIEQISAPTGYTKSDDKHEFTIDNKNDGETQTWDFMNIKIVPLTGSLKVNVTDSETEKGINGAEITITQKDNPEIKYTAETNTDGIALFPNLKYGDYIVEQTSTPKCYIKSDKKYEFTINRGNGGEIQVWDITNIKIIGNIQVKVVDDETGKAIVGSEITVTNKNNASIQYTVKTDDKGIALFENLGCGEYTAEQISTPKCFIKNEKTQDFSINDTNIGKTQTWDIINIKIIGNIQVKVVDDETGKAIVGSEITVTNKNNASIQYTAKTDDKGIALFENLGCGEYIAEQISTPKCFIKNEKTQDFSINDTNIGKTQTWDIINIKIVGNIQVKVVDDETGKAIVGSEITVTNKSNASIQYTAKTDDKGIALFENLGCGEYIAEQISTPKCFIKNDKTQEFSIDAITFGKTQTWDIINIRVLGNIQVNLVDSETGKAIIGSEISVTNKNNASIQYTSKTNDKGIALFENLGCGEYIVIQTSTPICYVKSNDNQIFTIDITSDRTTQNWNLSNDKVNGILKVSVVNSITGAKIEKARIALYGDFNILISEEVTDKDGIVIFDNLKCGEYYYKQTASPLGYLIDNSKYSFKIEQNNSSVEQVIKNVKRYIDDSISDNNNIDDIIDNNAGNSNSSDGGSNTNTSNTNTNTGNTNTNTGNTNTNTGNTNTNIGNNKVDEVIKEDIPKDTIDNNIEKLPTDKNLPEGSDNKKETESSENISISKPDTSDKINEGKEGTIAIEEGGNVESTTQPLNGIVSIDENGKWVYTPNADFEGKDSFTVTISHADGTKEDIIMYVDVPSKTSALEIQPKTPADTIKRIQEKITPIEDKKVGIIETTEGGNVKIVSQPSNGIVSMDENGEWTYIPNSNFEGADSFTVTISHADGTKEDIIVDIDVSKDTSKPNTNVESKAKLPQTGESSHIGFYLIGIAIVALGVLIGFKNKKKDNN